MVRLPVAFAALFVLALVVATPSVASEVDSDPGGNECGPGTPTDDAEHRRPGFIVEHAPEFVLNALEKIPVPKPVREFLDGPACVD